MKSNTGPLLKKWIGHPEASAFTAAKADKGLPRLKWEDSKELEKQLCSIQNQAGGAGAISTRILGLFDERGQMLDAKIKLFRDEAQVINNPREEAAELLESLRSDLMVAWAKDVSDLVKLAGGLYNQTMQLRRYLFVCLKS